MSDLPLKPALNAEPSVWTRIAALRQQSVTGLAPLFRAALEDAVNECQSLTISTKLSGDRRAILPLDVVIFETLRSDELQAIYFAQGTTAAKTARGSWHFYGLAADLISKRFEWFDGEEARAQWPDAKDRAAVGAAWFRAVGEVCIKHGLEWGGNWHHPDLPHVQWGKCHDSPHEAPAIYDRAGGGDAGRRAVWLAVGAI